MSYGTDRHRSVVISPLEGFQDTGVRALLHQVARGEVPREKQEWNDGNDEPGLRASAYLAIAKQGDRDVKTEVESLLPQVPRALIEPLWKSV